MEGAKQRDVRLGVAVQVGVCRRQSNGGQPQRVGQSDSPAKVDATFRRVDRPEKARHIYRLMATLDSNGNRVWIDAHRLYCGCRADQYASPADEYVSPANEYTTTHFDIYSGAADCHIHRHPSANGNCHYSHAPIINGNVPRHKRDYYRTSSAKISVKESALHGLLIKTVPLRCRT